MNTHPQQSARTLPTPIRALFLVGFMGAGKTSVGRELGTRLGWTFVDVDDRIALREGRSIPDIFREDGEPAFRRMESAALLDIISEVRGGKPTIIAVGGGAFIQDANEQAMRTSGIPVVFLDAPVDELRNRCALDGDKRPLFRNEADFRALYESRRQNYLRAEKRVDTSSKTVAQVADEVMNLFAGIERAK